MVDRLTKELSDKRATGSSTAPYIIEEEQRGNFLHVTVLWDEWVDIGAEERGQIIMDAYKVARPDDVSKISIAMGLTYAEAKRLGVAVE